MRTRLPMPPQGISPPYGKKCFHVASIVCATCNISASRPLGEGKQAQVQAERRTQAQPEAAGRRKHGNISPAILLPMATTLSPHDPRMPLAEFDAVMPCLGVASGIFFEFRLQAYGKQWLGVE